MASPDAYLRSDISQRVSHKKRVLGSGTTTARAGRREEEEEEEDDIGKPSPRRMPDATRETRLSDD
jgi:hypothetical protein